MPGGAFQSSHGVILTVGINNNTDRCQIVIPLATDDGGLDPVTLCSDAVDAATTTLVPLIQACMGTHAQITYIQAEGMMDGTIPYRVDFSANEYPGTQGTVTMPSNVTSLVSFYEDPASAGPGVRMRVAKNFIPGLAISEVTADLISDTLVALINAFAAAVRDGFATSAGGGNWYRVLAKASQTAVSELLRNIATSVARKYVATQRRRLVPHH